MNTLGADLTTIFEGFKADPAFLAFWDREESEQALQQYQQAVVADAELFYQTVMTYAASDGTGRAYRAIERATSKAVRNGLDRSLIGALPLLSNAKRRDDDKTHSALLGLCLAVAAFAEPGQMARLLAGSVWRQKLDRVMAVVLFQPFQRS
ncbi:MAG: hypothetical protein Q8O38_16590 [Sulfurimicrobium sp.]|nr:hypothetical protein [Sulfurimicrobium sp.]